MADRKSKTAEYADIEGDFNEALRFWHAGDPAGAEPLLLAIAEKRPELGPTFWILGGVQQDLGKTSEAIVHFRRATKLIPRSERASVGLFHALVEVGKVDEAFDELRRFRSSGPSPEFDQLIADFEAEFPEE